MNRLLIGFAAAFLAAGAPAQSLHVRLGGWDMTITADIKRAPRVDKFNTCVTKEDVDSSRAFQKDRRTTTAPTS